MRPKPKRLVVPLDIVPFSPPGNDDPGVRCLACRETLDLHQPEEAAPDRLLGTCTRCGRWFVMLIAIGESRAVLVMLPDLGSFWEPCDPSSPPDVVDTPRIGPPR